MKRLALSLWVLLAGCASVAAAPVTLSQIRAHLTQWEGYSLVPYRDGVNSWSVGVGHSLSANCEPVKARYSPAEVESLLLRDIAWSLDACRQGIRAFDELPERVQLVAIGVAFGVGRTGFDRFRSFRLGLSMRAFNGAAHELATSRWATQVSPQRRQHYVQTLLRLP